MPELIGGLDERRRPLLRVPVRGNDDILVIIDTAFTGELLLDEVGARQWGVVVVDVEAAIELGDGSRRLVKQGLLTIDWLDGLKDVTVQIIPQGSHRTRPDGNPGALIGTELLASYVRLIDFPGSHVSLATPDEYEPSARAPSLLSDHGRGTRRLHRVGHVAVDRACDILAAKEIVVGGNDASRRVSADDLTTGGAIR